MGGTISARELAEGMTRESARNFYRMMTVSHGRNLNKVTEDQWIEALTRWHLSASTPRPYYGERE